MHSKTGSIYNSEEYEKLDKVDKEECLPIDNDTKIDTIRRLQKPMSSEVRRAALSKLDKNKKKNRARTKAAKIAKRKNR